MPSHGCSATAPTNRPWGVAPSTSGCQRLDAAVAQEIEAKRLGFLPARDAVSPEGRTVAPLGPFDRSRVRHWLVTMAAEMAPIMTWLPQ
jgi:hypothetical protein